MFNEENNPIFWLISIITIIGINLYKNREKKLKHITFERVYNAFATNALNFFSLLFIYYLSIKYAQLELKIDKESDYIQYLALAICILLPLFITFCFSYNIKNYTQLSLLGLFLFLFLIFFVPGWGYFTTKTLSALKLGGGQIIEISANKKTACTYPFLFEVNLTNKPLDCENSNSSEFLDLYRTKPLEVKYISRRIIILQGNHNFVDDTGEQKNSLATLEINRSEVRAVYFIDQIRDHSDQS